MGSVYIVGLYGCSKTTAEPKVTRFPILLVWLEFSTKWDTKLNVALTDLSLRYSVMHEVTFLQKHTHVPSSVFTLIHLPTEHFLDALL